MQAQLATAQEQLNEIMGKFSTVSANAETLAAQAARQRVMLQHPHLISDPIMKLVENSTLTADDLAATLGAMAQGQQQLVKQVYQEAQSGATPVVSPAAAQGSAKQEQAQASGRPPWMPCRKATWRPTGLSTRSTLPTPIRLAQAS